MFTTFLSSSDQRINDNFTLARRVCQHMLGLCGRRGTKAYFKAFNRPLQTVLPEVVNQVRSRVNFLNLTVSKQLGSSVEYKFS